MSTLKVLLFSFLVININNIVECGDSLKNVQKVGETVEQLVGEKTKNETSEKIPVTTYSNFLHEELAKIGANDVHISHHFIPNITADLFWDFVFVEEFKIEWCNVSDIEKNLFFHFRQLKRLSLKHNLLTKIEVYHFRFCDIVELDLSYNKIEKIAYGAFAEMIMLKKIDLSNNLLKTFDTSYLFGTRRPCEFHAENNLIETLSVSPHLQIFKNHEHGCPMELHFSNNKIKNIHLSGVSAFGLYLRIKNLHLDNNLISSIEKYTFFTGVEYIENLRLNHNQIVCMTPDLSKVKHYDVSENPWNKTCLKIFEQQKTKNGVEKTTTVRSVSRHGFYIRFR